MLRYLGEIDFPYAEIHVAINPTFHFIPSLDGEQQIASEMRKTDFLILTVLFPLFCSS